MHHVDAENRIGLVDRPDVGADVELDRREQVVESRLFAPRRNGSKGGRIRIARLPEQARKRAREMDRMFAGPAGDLERPATLRQDPAKDGEDRFDIARDMRRRSAMIGQAGLPSASLRAVCAASEGQPIAPSLMGPPAPRELP
jgi:hypothetical protein